MKRSPTLKARNQSGFTLIELLVVVLIIGILAAIAVPQYFKVVEKGKAAEALSFVDTFRGAQERYMTANGAYCSPTFGAIGGQITCGGTSALDIPVPAFKYFAPTGTGGATSWSVTMTRQAPTPAVYGAYAITATMPSIGALVAWTCSQADCTTDLLPQ